MRTAPTLWDNWRPRSSMRWRLRGGRDWQIYFSPFPTTTRSPLCKSESKMRASAVGAFKGRGELQVSNGTLGVKYVIISKANSYQLFAIVCVHRQIITEQVLLKWWYWIVTLGKQHRNKHKRPLWKNFTFTEIVEGNKTYFWVGRHLLLDDSSAVHLWTMSC